MRRRLAALLCLLLLAACAARFQLPGPAAQPPHWQGDAWTTADGLRLPVRSWLPPGPPRAVILALHGMNDYSNFFDDAGRSLAARGIAAYAYDQRGFGAAPQPGIFSSSRAMAADARAALALLAARHPGVPLYLLGESMGGAVALVAADAGDLPVKGVILSAPAVWGWSSMGFFPRAALWLSYQVAPGWELTGRGLDIMPSDNIPMLRKLSADPLVIKATRVDAIHGLVGLMDDGAAAAPRLRLPALVLYGAKDEVVPAAPTWAAIAAMPAAPKAAFYANGYHMLMRDLQAETVLGDIAAWIADPAAPLPSGADRAAADELARRGGS